jgi:hypothetical protein
MVKHKDAIWRHFGVFNDPTKKSKVMKCYFCTKVFTHSITKGRHHLATGCPKAPADVRAACDHLVNSIHKKSSAMLKRSMSTSSATASAATSSATMSTSPTDTDIEVTSDGEGSAIEDAPPPVSTSTPSSSQLETLQVKMFSGSGKTRQPTLTSADRSASVSSAKWIVDELTSQEEGEAHQLLARTIYSSNSAFSLVENEHLRKLFQHLRPAYRPPSRRQIGEGLLDKEYNRLQLIAKDVIKDRRAITYCTGKYYKCNII